MDYTLPDLNFLEFKVLEQVNNRGLFEIGPLSPGYGVTIGNSLRRVLLSSLEGAAITSVKIEGVNHQFSSLNKIKEDVVEIILNLKMLRFDLISPEPAVLKLLAKGPKDVTALSFAENPQCQIVNTDAHIASLGKGANLKMEINVARGRGYVPVERRQDEKLPIGTIAVDSIFTPVKKVHYEVENTRVGGMTNFDKLSMEITTDASIEPDKALGNAAQILLEHFSIIEQACQKDVAKTTKESVEEKKTLKKEKPKTKKKTSVKKIAKKSKK